MVGVAVGEGLGVGGPLPPPPPGPVVAGIESTRLVVFALGGSRWAAYQAITEYLDQNDEVVITARTVAVLTEGPK